MSTWDEQPPVMLVMVSGISKLVGQDCSGFGSNRTGTLSTLRFGVCSGFVSPLGIRTSCFVVFTEQSSLDVVNCANCTRAKMFSSLTDGKLPVMDVMIFFNYITGNDGVIQDILSY